MSQPENIQVSCPNCKTVVQISSKYIGQTVACGACSSAFEVKAPAPPPAKAKVAIQGPPKPAAKVAIVAPRKASIEDVAPMPVARGSFKKPEPLPWYKQYMMHMSIGGGAILLLLIFFLFIKPAVTPAPPPPPEKKEAYVPAPPPPDPEAMHLSAADKTVI
jgi:hypothetical protein